MWDYGYNEEAMVNLRDSVPGIVKGQSRSGLYIDLNIENDFDDRKELVPAFGYWRLLDRKTSGWHKGNVQYQN